jgi:hypothetical protein
MMKLTATAVMVGAAVVLTLTACSSSTPATTKTPVKNVSYSSVADLRDAFVKAGGACDSGVQDNVVGGAAESGTCDEETVLSTYLSTDSRDTVVDNVKTIGAGMVDVTMLVGKNWIVNSPDAAKVKAELGGTMVSTSAG